VCVCVCVQERVCGRVTRKFSSCSTIFIDDSTVSQPNLKNTIRAVALAVYFHIKNRNRGINGSIYPPDEQDDRLVEIFDEKLHPLSVSTCLSVCLVQAHCSVVFQYAPESMWVRHIVAGLYGVGLSDKVKVSVSFPLTMRTIAEPHNSGPELSVCLSVCLCLSVSVCLSHCLDADAGDVVGCRKTQYQKTTSAVIQITGASTGSSGTCFTRHS